MSRVGEARKGRGGARAAPVQTFASIVSGTKVGGGARSSSPGNVPTAGNSADSTSQQTSNEDAQFWSTWFQNWFRRASRVATYSHVTKLTGTGVPIEHTHLISVHILTRMAIMWCALLMVYLIVFGVQLQPSNNQAADVQSHATFSVPPTGKVGKAEKVAKAKVEDVQQVVAATESGTVLLEYLNNFLRVPFSSFSPMQNRGSDPLENLCSDILQIVQKVQMMGAVVAWAWTCVVSACIEHCSMFVRTVSTLYATYMKLQKIMPGAIRSYDGSFQPVSANWDTFIHDAKSKFCIEWRQDIVRAEQDFTLRQMFEHPANPIVIQRVQQTLKNNRGAASDENCDRSQQYRASEIVLWKPGSELDTTDTTLTTVGGLEGDSNTQSTTQCEPWVVTELVKRVQDTCIGANARDSPDQSVKDVVHESVIEFCKKSEDNAAACQKCSWASIQVQVKCEIKNPPSVDSWIFKPQCSMHDSNTHKQSCSTVQKHECHFKYCVQDIREAYIKHQKELEQTNFPYKLLLDLLRPAENEGQKTASWPENKSQTAISENWFLHMVGAEWWYSWVILAACGLWACTEFKNLTGDLRWTDIVPFKCLVVTASCLAVLALFSTK